VFTHLLVQTFAERVRAVMQAVRRVNKMLKVLVRLLRYSRCGSC
jgi:hypothetical protein